MDQDLKAMNKGVKCGNRDAHGQGRVYHPNSDEVRECYAETRYQNENAEREAEIERAYERHLEDRGYDAARWDEDRERELAGW